jgi:hypothetical protein
VGHPQNGSLWRGPEVLRIFCRKSKDPYSSNRQPRCGVYPMAVCHASLIAYGKWVFIHVRGGGIGASA